MMSMERSYNASEDEQRSAPKMQRVEDNRAQPRNDADLNFAIGKLIENVTKAQDILKACQAGHVEKEKRTSKMERMQTRDEIYDLRTTIEEQKRDVERHEMSYDAAMRRAEKWREAEERASKKVKELTRTFKNIEEVALEMQQYEAGEIMSDAEEEPVIERRLTRSQQSSSREDDLVKNIEKLQKELRKQQRIVKDHNRQMSIMEHKYREQLKEKDRLYEARTSRTMMLQRQVANKSRECVLLSTKDGYRDMWREERDNTERLRMGIRVLAQQLEGNMSAAGAKFPWKECDICIREFKDAAELVPRFLPCGHTFCHSCLEQLSGWNDTVRGFIRCPVDRKNFVVDKVADLPKNYKILHQ
ncbi:unnamed protein product [Caenorhabditis sp. 36 PRJEB53466]|nr:unnamed protein product [Caenorhabditis sp. 36 PRJEB53466]